MHPTPSFEELFAQLTPTLTQLETERQVARKKALKTIFVYFLIVGAITAVYIRLYIRSGSVDSSLSVVVILIMLLTILVWWGLFSRSKSLTTKYKNTVIPRMVEVLVENGTYSSSSGIPNEIIYESGFLRPSGLHRSEDLITGKIGKTNFRFAEVYPVGSDSDNYNNYLDTIFRGFMFVVDFPKNFAGHTTVSRNSLYFKRDRARVFKCNRDHARVRLENPKFEERFDVFSDDQVEARYLLTPSMMERIIELDMRFDYGIVLRFCYSNIYVFINANGMKVSLWSKINNKKTFYREYAVISDLIAIVDELNLNTRIWTKE